MQSRLQVLAMPAAMVLCAGFGTRLRPLTDTIPKPLLAVGCRPAVMHAIDALVREGFGPVVMNTHHRAEAFDAAVPAHVHIVHEPEILGTAGGVSNASSWLGPGDVLVCNGDIVAEPDLARLLEDHARAVRSGAVATLLAARRPCGHGTLGVDESDRIVRLRGEVFGAEQCGADFVGIQIITSHGRDRLPAQGCLVGDVYLPLLREGRTLAVSWHNGAWDDIGSPKALVGANLRWLERERLEQWVDPSAFVEDRVQVIRSVVCANARVVGQGTLRECLVLAGSTAQAPAAKVIVYGQGQVIPVG
jgi:mannose-1-phosphate guanylyltransferase